MDSAGRPGLLELLPPEMLEGASLPLAYRLLVPPATGESPLPQRVAESQADRALVYTCLPFYKPLSRCVGGRG